MATDQSFVDYIQERSGLGADLGFKEMFGECALYLDGRELLRSLLKKTASALPLPTPLPTPKPTPEAAPGRKPGAKAKPPAKALP